MENLDAALVDLLKQNKSLYKTIINKFTFGVSDKVPTASVAWDKSKRQFEVVVNCRLERELTVDQIKAMLIHEISHVFMLHLFRVGNMNVRKFNVAADLIINEGSYEIQKELKPLFPNAVWVDTVRLKGPLPENREEWTAELVYELLEDAKDNWDDHDRLCELDPEVMDEVRDMVESMGQRSVTGDGGGSFVYVFKALRQRERETATINCILRSFSSTFKTKSSNKFPSWLRKNRKLPNLPVQGKLNKTPMPHLIIGVDISGSMLDHLPLIDRFLSSLNKLNATFDLSIGDESERVFLSYHELKKTNFRIPKVEDVGGGTNLNFVADRFNSGGYNGTILFTDGILSFPNLPDNKTIVVLTENTKVPFTKTVRING